MRIVELSTVFEINRRGQSSSRLMLTGCLIISVNFDQYYDTFDVQTKEC